MKEKTEHSHLRKNAINSKSQKINYVLDKNLIEKTRYREFLQCLGSGRSLIEIEQEERLEGDSDE